MKVTDIPLTDVMERYLSVGSVLKEGKNRWKIVCPFHKDTAPSLVLYDKTEDGGGWDYHCFVCGAHGNAVSMLVDLGKATSEDQAVDMLMQDFNLKFPAKVTVVEFAKFKGLDADYLKENGWKDIEQGVAIPYLTQRHDPLATKVRVKYHGKDKYIYKNDASNPASHLMPYGLHWLDTYDAELPLYITEGETDCMTLRQAGFQAIGLPSANGFKPEFYIYFDRFETIVVVKDNDEPGWKLVTDLAVPFKDRLYMVVMPKGIKDINSYHMAKCRAETEMFKRMFPNLQVLPATPDTFIKAVASGEVEPIERACWDMVARYLPYETEQLYFKERMVKEGHVSKTLVNSCMKSMKRAKEETDGMGEFLIKDNCYYKSVGFGNRQVEVKISNFILVPEHDIRSDDDITRVVTLTNQQGETKKGVKLSSEAMTSTNKLNLALVGSGNFIFTGTTEDLFKLCIMIFEQTKHTLHSPKRIGRLESGGWLFGNLGIDSKGRIVRPANGVIDMDGTAYVPRSVVVDDGDASTSQDVPSFNLADYRKTCEKDFLYKTAYSLKTTFGTYGAYLGLGWAVAGWFSDMIFDEYGFFPYLFVSGKRSSGKSVLSTMLQGVYGFDAANAGMSIETPSNVGILRYLGYRSSLPCWYDDYRSGVKRIQMKDGLLLDVYNRHGSIKGTREGGTVFQEKINGFVLLSGEDTPSNNALLTRCCVVQLSANERDPDYFTEAQSYMALLRTKALKWAKASSRGDRRILDCIAECTEYIFNKNGDIRYARNYGIFAGAFLYAFGDVILDKKEFMKSLAANAYLEKKEIDGAHPMAEFFNDFPDMIAKGFLVRDREFTVLSDGNVAIRMREAHKGWTDYKRAAPLSEKTLRDYVRKECFFHSEDRVYFPSAGRFRGFILRPEKMKTEFEDFCEAVVHVDVPPEY